MPATRASLRRQPSHPSKATRRKIRRRGDRTIFEYGNERLTYISCRGGQQLIEVRRPHEHYRVTYDPSGQLALMRGEHDGRPVQRVHDTATGEFVAGRVKDGGFWLIIDPDDPDAPLISVDDVPIENRAIVAGSVKGRLSDELAEFLGVNPLFCSTRDVDAILKDPRYALVRDFQFSVMPLHDVGAGRRAENAIRHNHTNYDAMISRAGGLLHPDVYERVRLGVDRLVKAHVGTTR